MACNYNSHSQTEIITMLAVAHLILSDCMGGRRTRRRKRNGHAGSEGSSLQTDHDGAMSPMSVLTSVSASDPDCVLGRGDYAPILKGTAHELHATLA